MRFYIARRRGSLEGLKYFNPNDDPVFAFSFELALDRDEVDSAELVGDRIAPPTNGESMNICGSISAYLDTGLAAVSGARSGVVRPFVLDLFD